MFWTIGIIASVFIVFVIVVWNVNSKPLVSCGDCEHYYKISGHSFCKCENQQRFDPVNGSTYSQPCREVNRNGNCNYYVQVTPPNPD